MRLAYRLVFLLVLIILFPIWGHALDVQLVQYTHFYNLKGIMSVPEGKGPFPVVIYSYDQYYDWADKDFSNKQGYVLEDFMRIFNEKGFVCFIPLERYRKINALIGAVHYLNKKSFVDKHDIHIVGQGEGAFLSLFVFSEAVDVQTVTLITPERINSTGFFSLPGLLREVKTIPASVLILSAEYNKVWRLDYERMLWRLLRQYQSDIVFRKYRVTRRFFWNPRQYFIDDIVTFIKER